MQRQMLKSKIHRPTITDCDVDYVGSITLDPNEVSTIDSNPTVSLGEVRPEQEALL